MKTTDANTNLIDSYFTLLKGLSANNKLEIIARLSKSLKTPEKNEDNSWKDLFGALALDQSAEEFIKGLKSDRKFIRKTVVL